MSLLSAAVLCLIAGVAVTHGQTQTFNFVCTFVDSLNCGQSDQTPVCASDSVKYTSECEFTKANCKDVNLKVVDCNGPYFTTTPQTPVMTTSSNTTDVANATSDGISFNSTMDPSTVNTTVITIPVDMFTFNSSDIFDTPTAPSNLSTDDPMLNSTDIITDDPFVNSTGGPWTNITDGPWTNITDGPWTNITGDPWTNSTGDDFIDNSINRSTTTTTTGAPILDFVCQILVQQDCPPDDSPVCASNMVAYPSLCEYTKARCLIPGITVLQSGTCDSLTTPPPALNQVLCGALASDICFDDKVVLCGSDGITYSNSCLFEREKCQKDSLHVKHVGMCNK